MTRSAGLAPGVVRVRLSGAAADVGAAAAVFSGGASADDIEVIETSGRYPNRRDPGERLYLVIRLAAAGQRPERGLPSGGAL